MKNLRDVPNAEIPECDLIDEFVLRRLKSGLHTHILVTGLQGKGKSDFGIRMGERLSERIENGVGFSHLDIVDSLLKLLGRIKEIKKPGEIILIEEVSVLFPSRRSMSSDNVAIGRIFDTIRKKQAIIISNAPLYPSVDSHMRALSEVLVECQRIMKAKKLVKVKAWKLQTNPHSGKTYKHRFRRNNVIVPYHYSKQSNKEIRALYEKEKDRFIDELYQKLYAKAEAVMKKENPDLNAKKITLKQNFVLEELKKGKTLQEVADMLQVTPTAIRNHKASLEKKGFLTPKYLEKSLI